MSIRASFNFPLSNFPLAVDLNLPDQGISAIFGPSGCGKTTLLRLMAGLERCDNGIFRIGNRVWQDQDFFLPTHKRALGYVFQEASLFPHLNVEANIKYGLKRKNQSTETRSFDALIQLLGVDDLLNRNVTTLSGGETQRIAIARALASQPDLLLMDEPFSAIDSQRKQEILPYLQRLHAELKIPVVYVTHCLEEASQLADQLVVMENGMVTAEGETTSMLTRLDLPQINSTERVSIIDARVANIDTEFALSYLDFPGGQFSLPAKDLSMGQSIRIQVAARDVSLSLEHAQNSSILNIFPAIVVETINDGDSQVLVRLALKQSQLLSRISKKSANALKLVPGTSVFAQIKTAALLS